jgi:putative transposase
MQDIGFLNGCRYLLHDRDKKFCREFRETIAAGGIESTPLPARSPNLNAQAERWVRSIKEECLSKLILFGEASLRRVVVEYLAHYHRERITRARAICCSFRNPCRGSRIRRAWSIVESGSAAYSSTTAGRREYLEQTASV